MAFFNFPFKRFPYTNFHELNLDWILQAVKSAVEKSEEALAVKTTADAAAQNASEALATANSAAEQAGNAIEAIPYYLEGYDDSSCVREVGNDVLGLNYEYLNPPFEPGELYRTAERFAGDPVYAGYLVETRNGIEKGEKVETDIVFYNTTPDFSQIVNGKKFYPVEMRAYIVNGNNIENITNIPSCDGGVTSSGVMCDIDRNSDWANMYFSYYDTVLSGVNVKIVWFVKLCLV